SRKASRAGPAKNVRQNRFGLVVRRVADNDACRSTLGDHALEERIPETPGGVFQIPPAGRSRSGNVFAPRDAFKFAVTCKVLDKTGVRLRFRAAKFVIEMDDDQSDAKPVTQGLEDPEKRD